MKKATKNKSNIASIVKAYLNEYNEELSALRLAFDQSQKAKTDVEITNRRNFVGHFTASIFVINPSNEKVLLLDHKGLKMKLQPGGHIDEGESPLEAALRELKEETGLNACDMAYRPACSINTDIPFHISSHRIPKNDKKQEDAHYHHDLEYVFFINNQNPIIIDQAESNGFEWVPWSDFAKDNHFKDQVPKIKELIANRSDTVFYDQLCNKIFKEQLQKAKDYRLIIIEHILPSTYNFLLYLNNIFGEVSVFAKPNSINQEIYQRLIAKGIKIKIAKRSPSKDKVKFYFGDDLKTPTLILDIGGYLADITSANKKLPIKGIVEDTENGYKKYLDKIHSIPYKVISVARSNLKENEDFLVGKAITRAADAILRTKNLLLEYCQASVVGYGKIGRSISRCLLEHDVKPTVVEKDPIRALKAVNEYCYVSDIEDALEKSKIIFCASGAKSISLREFRMIRDGAFLISVTSSDDEYDTEFLLSEYKKQKINQYIDKYYSDNNYFYLVNDGCAPNFLFEAALGPFIYPTLGGCIAGLLLMSNDDSVKQFRRGVIGELNYKTEQAIAKVWLEEFTSRRFYE